MPTQATHTHERSTMTHTTSQPPATRVRILPRKGGAWFQGNNGVMFWRTMTLREFSAAVGSWSSDIDGWSTDPWLVSSVNAANWR